jgi:predicted neuraminidase
LKKYLQKFSLVFLSDDSQAANIKPNKGVDKDNRHFSYHSILFSYHSIVKIGL